MTAPTESGFIHRELGKIVVTLEMMKEDQEDFLRETKDHRIEISTQMHELFTRVARVEDVTKASANSLSADVLPTIIKVKTWEQRGIGFLAFAGIAGTGLGAAIVKYSSELHAFIGSFFK